MKETKVIKKLIILIILSAVCIGINTKALAANNTAGNTNTSQTNTSSSNSTANSTSTKSSNANLSTLGINPNDFKGFKKATTEYNVTVPETVSVVEVYAKAEDSKATVSGTGSKSLSKGNNTIPVVVIAEDGTKKTYTINLVRGEATAATEETETEDEATTKSGLSELTIENVTLDPSFATDIYEYTAKYIGTETKLNITSKASEANYTVDVTGNNNLQEGENLVTILVSDKDAKNVATYQITINKSLIDEEAIAKENQEKQEKQKKLIIICSAVVFGIVVIVGGAILIHKRRMDREYDEYYDDDEYEDDYEENINNNYYEDDDIQDKEEVKTEAFISNKDELKKKFLENYNNDNYNDEEEETSRKRKGKGKRFK